MKIIKVLLAALIFSFLSCQVEEDVQIENVTSIEKGDFGNPPGDGLGEPWDSWNTDLFKKTLNDIGKLITRTVINDTDAEIAFMQFLADHNNVVDLSVLLDHSNPQQRDFYEAFRIEYFQWVGVCPGGGSIDPYPGENGRASNASFEAFLYNIQYQHCLEIYMPYGYNDGTSRGFSNSYSNYMISAAHPLSTASSTIGYRYPVVDFSVVCDGSLTVIDGTSVISTTSTNYYNLLIIRPEPNYEMDRGTYCDYLIYDDIDFTDWFSN